jgi:predicted nuclease with RNAse H fold
MKNKKQFFIGIDLGWKNKKTTGLCILENKKSVLLKDIFGRDLLKAIRPFLKETKVIAIDAPLTQGKGKGRMRLYEKFLSTSVFRKEKVNPLPPALIFKLSDFAREVVEKLEKEGFILGINLIEVFPTLIRKICKEEVSLKDSLTKIATKNQESALLCAQTALLHSQFKTRWLGYKDGFLFLPEVSFWKKDWQEKFYRTWKNRPRLRYHRLITNLFKYY